jgi:hypothetical protein
LFSFQAQAQVLNLHGHPQKAVYASPSEWPTEEVQCWWPEATALPEEHGHFSLTSPRYAELTGPVVVSFVLKLHNLPGVADVRSEGVRDLIWDAPPTLRGGDGLFQWTGHMTFDPTLPTRWHTVHGWWAPLIDVAMYFDSGDSVSVRLIPTFYALLDATAPESSVIGNPLTSANCHPASARHPEVIWGDNFVQTTDFLPVSPIAAPYSLWMATAGYGAQGLPPAVFQQRVDLDVHNGIPGTILKSVTQDGDINTSVTFDPATLGSGSHKAAIFRTQASLDGTEEINTLLVFDAVVGAGVPPPTTCTDTTALNNGDPLPCVYPIVPPPPIWTVGTVFSTPTPTGLHFELCAALNPNDVNACHAVP